MYATVLTDSDLLLHEQFETRTLPNDGFRHREHVRLTWIYLTLEPASASAGHTVDIVAERLCRSLLELATTHGVAQRFHHTLTVAWVRIIEFERRSNPDMPFDALAVASPALLNKDTPLWYYSRERLYSDEARHRWIEPDLQPLPPV
jgi:hypothetical protein